MKTEENARLMEAICYLGLSPQLIIRLGEAVQTLSCLNVHERVTASKMIQPYFDKWFSEKLIVDYPMKEEKK